MSATRITSYQPIGNAAYALRLALPYDPSQAQAVSILDTSEALRGQELPLPFAGVTVTFTDGGWTVSTPDQD